jgi:hypothetical protein
MDFRPQVLGTGNETSQSDALKKRSIREFSSQWSQFDVDSEQLPLNQCWNTESGLQTHSLFLLAF